METFNPEQQQDNQLSLDKLKVTAENLIALEKAHKEAERAYREAQNAYDDLFPETYQTDEALRNLQSEDPDSFWALRDLVSHDTSRNDY